MPMPRFLYRAERTPGAGGPATVEIFRRTQQQERRVGLLNPRCDLRNHSPDGFQWGYAGSGPAQLALALCVHSLIAELIDNADAGTDVASRSRVALCERRALAVYQNFKFTILAGQQADRWSMDDVQIRDAITALEAQGITA
jgi:hypothetical protein